MADYVASDAPMDFFDELDALHDAARALEGVSDRAVDRLFAVLVETDAGERRNVAVRYRMAAALSRWLLLDFGSDVGPDEFKRWADLVSGMARARSREEVVERLRGVLGTLGGVSGGEVRRREKWDARLGSLTGAQRRAYDFIEAFVSEHGGVTPNFVMIGRALGVTPQSARAHVLAVSDKVPWVRYDRDLRRIIWEWGGER